MKLVSTIMAVFAMLMGLALADSAKTTYTVEMTGVT
jgi:hypothetical protein